MTALALMQATDWAGVPGAALAVLQSGEATFAFHGRHCADERSSSVSPATMWEAASLTKPVVALAALRHADGDSDFLHAPLSTSAEAFGAARDPRWSEITLELILTHATGLPNWRLPGEPLRFDADPGTPGYSGEAFELLLSELVVRSGVSAERLLADHLDRIGMADSSFAAAPQEPGEVATGHDEQGTPVPKQLWQRPMASGSLHTTIADYARFVGVIADPGSAEDPALRAAAVKATQRSVEYLPDIGRSLGWALVGGNAGDVVSQHGDNPGFKHVAAVRPETGEAVVVFTNSDHGQQPYRAICKAVLGVEVW